MDMNGDGIKDSKDVEVRSTLSSSEKMEIREMELRTHRM
jgi:hypothetical protein